jgi:hypothetical protein
MSTARRQTHCCGSAVGRCPHTEREAPSLTHPLVEHHADQERIVIIGQELIGFGIAGEPKRSIHAGYSARAEVGWVRAGSATRTSHTQDAVSGQAPLEASSAGRRAADLR